MMRPRFALRSGRGPAAALLTRVRLELRSSMRPVRGLMERLTLGLLLLALIGLPARADSMADALANFTTDSFVDTEKGIAQVAASGAPTAEAVLQALANRQL